MFVAGRQFPNVRCDGQFEIDLLAIDPVTLDRYHIETSVSGSTAFSKLTAKPFDPLRLKERVQQATMRRTLGYFIERKFGSQEIVTRLSQFGFKPGAHKKVVVTWGWTAEAKREADATEVALWDFRDVMEKIADKIRYEQSYFTDDTLRTINLFVRALADKRAKNKQISPPSGQLSDGDRPESVGSHKGSSAMSIYDPLRDYLRQHQFHELELSFAKKRRSLVVRCHAAQSVRSGGQM